MPSKVSLRVSSTHIPFQRLSKVSTAMISRNAPHNKARGLTQVSDLVSQSGSFGHWAGMKPRVGILHSRPFNILRKAEGRSDTTSWIWEGSSRLLAHGGLTVSSTAEPQIGSRAVWRVLAPSSTAVPVAVGLARDREKGECSQTHERVSTVRFMLYPSRSSREGMTTGNSTPPATHTKHPVSTYVLERAAHSEFTT